ncbi:hypothetical protein Ddye_017402, partial [Dipteronia dyeriana]
FRELPVLEVLTGLLSRVSREELAFICVIIWGLWRNLNAVLNGGKPGDPADLVSFHKGATIGDDKGRVVVAIPEPLAGVFNAEVDDFLAHQEGILPAKNHNLNVQIAEVDASYVAIVLKSMDLF